MQFYRRGMMFLRERPAESLDLARSVTRLQKETQIEILNFVLQTLVEVLFL